MVSRSHTRHPLRERERVVIIRARNQEGPGSDPSVSRCVTSLPSISMFAGVLHPILLKMDWMPTLSAFTVFIAASYFFSYCSAFISVRASRS